MVLLSAAFSLVLNRGPELSAAALTGAQSGLTLALSLGGSICLWSGLGRVMEKSGLSRGLSRLLMPLLGRLFPTARRDSEAAAYLSANFTANLLGLGNAATPAGIRAARRLAEGCGGTASDDLCRLVVLNTASVQLLPTTVASVRAGLGCAAPLDILPAVWVSSVLSVTAGLATAGVLRRMWRDRR